MQGWINGALIGLLVAAVVIGPAWLIGNWIERRQRRKLQRAHEPVAQAAREESKELTRLADEVSYGALCLRVDSKLAPQKKASRVC